MPSAAHLRGTVAGAAIMTLFGSGWCLISLASWSGRPGWAIPTGCLAALARLSMCVLRFSSLRHLIDIDDPAAAAKGKRAGLYFGLIFGAECLIISLTSMLLARDGLSIWIPIAVALIVGLHFLPLARVFDVPIYYGTGALIVVGMLLCAQISNADSRVICAGLAMAALLWTTALVLLLPGWKRQPVI